MKNRRLFAERDEMGHAIFHQESIGYNQGSRILIMLVKPYGSPSGEVFFAGGNTEGKGELMITLQSSEERLEGIT